MSEQVVEQGENLDLIVDHIEDAHHKVENGNKQIVQAKKYQSSRGKMLVPCVIGIIAIVVLVVVFVMLSSDK